MIGFDVKELTKFEKDLLNLATKQMPKESKKFLKNEGVKLGKLTRNIAKTKIKSKTGNLLKGIKSGKVYTYSGNGALSVRVFGKKPAYHVGLVNNGHRQVNKHGEEVGFVEGEHFLEAAEKEFENTYYNDTQEFIDDMLEKGLS